MQQLRLKPHQLKLAVPPVPKGLELSYSTQLQRVQRQVNEEVASGVVVLEASAGKVEAFEPTRSKALAIIAAAVPVIARVFGDRTAGWNTQKYDTPVGNLVGLNAGLSSAQQKDMLDGWVAENVSLITNANTEQLARIEAAVLRASRSGAGGKELRQEIAGALGATKSRVNLIARDQIGKLNGQLDRAKQTGAGIDSYRWRTSADERVRPEHAAREGQTFSWKNPPPGGHPGQAVRCRCTAEPAIDTALLTPEELAEAEATVAARTAARKEQLKKPKPQPGRTAARTSTKVAEATKRVALEKALAARREAEARAAALQQAKAQAQRAAEQATSYKMPISTTPIRLQPSIAAELDKTTRYQARGTFRGGKLDERQQQADRLARWVNADPNRLRQLTFEEQREVFAWEWVHGSNRKLSVTMKHAVQEELGAAGKIVNDHDFFIQRDWIDASKPAIRRIYEDTQELLKRGGVDRPFTLHRGMKEPRKFVGTIESWSTEQKTTKRFGPVQETAVVQPRQVIWYRGAPGWMDGIYGNQQEVVTARGIP